MNLKNEIEKNIKKFAISSTHCLFIDHKNLLHGFGSNLKNELFFFKKEVVLSKKRLGFKVPVDKVYVDDHFSAIITLTKDLYISDDLKNYILIDNNVLDFDKSTDFFIYIKEINHNLNLMIYHLEENHLSFLNQHPPQKPINIYRFAPKNFNIVAGYNCVGIIIDNILRVWGDNLYNNFTSTEFDYFFANFKELELKNIKKVKFSKGKRGLNEYVNFFLTEDGYLYSNENWSLEHISIYKNFKLIAEDVLDFDSGSGHILILKNNKTLWGIGENHLKQIKFKEDKEYKEWIKITDHAEGCYAGDGFSLYVDKFNAVIACGLNQFGILNEKKIGFSVEDSIIFYLLKEDFEDNQKDKLKINNLPNFLFLKQNKTLQLSAKVSNIQNLPMKFKWFFDKILINETKDFFLELRAQDLAKLTTKKSGILNVEVFVDEKLHSIKKSLLQIENINNKKYIFLSN